MKRAREFQGWVQISVGCNCGCSYCIVPSTRGREVCRPLDELVAEVERLAADGVREVTLLGQNVNSYGRDLPAGSRARRSPSCCARSTRSTGIERIRYTSPHPKDMREDVIRAHAELPALCEHIHLPLQSGSTRILKAMRRTYDRERYLDRVALIREHVPDCALTTDIIVGFPGETEADFAQTLEVVEEVGYDGAFTFIFSPRRGTEAATLHRRSVPHEVEGRADGAARRGRPAPRARARAALRRPHARRARRGPVAHRPVAAARPLAPQQGRQLRRPRAAGRDRAGRDHARDEPDAGRRGVAARARGALSGAAAMPRAHERMPRRGLVIFDCDGVLVDSVRLDMRELRRAMLRELGGPMTARARSVDAFDGAALADIERGGRGAPRPAACRPSWMERFLADGCTTAFERELQPSPASREALDALRAPAGTLRRVQRRPRAGCSTRCGVTGLRDALRRAASSRADEVARGKPAPDLFLHAAARDGLRRRRAASWSRTACRASRAGRAARHAHVRLRGGDAARAAAAHRARRRAAAAICGAARRRLTRWSRRLSGLSGAPTQNERLLHARPGPLHGVRPGSQRERAAFAAERAGRASRAAGACDAPRASTPASGSRSAFGA